MAPEPRGVMRLKPETRDSIRNSHYRFCRANRRTENSSGVSRARAQVAERRYRKLVYCHRIQTKPLPAI